MLQTVYCNKHLDNPTKHRGLFKTRLIVWPLILDYFLFCCRISRLQQLLCWVKWCYLDTLLVVVYTAYPTDTVGPEYAGKTVHLVWLGNASGSPRRCGKKLPGRGLACQVCCHHNGWMEGIWKQNGVRMSGTGAPFAAACFLLVSLPFRKWHNRKDKSGRRKGLGRGDLGISRSAIIKNREGWERRNVSNSRNARELLALWIQQEIA